VSLVHILSPLLVTNAEIWLLISPRSLSRKLGAVEGAEDGGFILVNASELRSVCEMVKRLSQTEKLSQAGIEHRILFVYIFLVSHNLSPVRLDHMPWMLLDNASMDNNDA
jgi:hypothetical protein